MMFPSWAMKRVYKFVLKRVLGRLLRGELDLDKLDVQLGAGTVELKDLELNTDYLNDQLQETAVELLGGYIGTIRATIPWSGITKQSCLVVLEDLEVYVGPRQVAPLLSDSSASLADNEAGFAPSWPRGNPDDDDDGVDTAAGNFDNANGVDGVDDLGRDVRNNIHDNDIDSRDPNNLGGDDDDSDDDHNSEGGAGGAAGGGAAYGGVDEGVKVIAKLVEKVLLGLRVSVKNLV
eukprot:jgi/Mesen1/7529/ME000391S06767